MRVAVIGVGAVGWATGVGLQMHGNETIFYDVDLKKLKVLEEEGFRVAKSIEDAVHYSEVSFICVQTHYNDGVDLTHLKDAVIGVAGAIGEEGYHVVAVRSTIPPFTTKNLVVPLLQKHSGLRAGVDFGVCFNPEFLREASALQDFMSPSRIVIGEFDKKAGDILEELYRPFNTPIIRTTPETAEMIKYVANAFLATKISFFNEVFMLCVKVGIDPNLVAETVALDPRIGTYGIYGGKPFGGKCLPKDLRAFIQFFMEMGVEPTLLSAVLAVNEKMKKLQEEDGGKCLW